MLNEALLFLLDVLLQPFAALLLLRFHMQWLRAPLRNPHRRIRHGAHRFSGVARAPFCASRIRGLDSATLLLALLTEMLYLTALLWVLNTPCRDFILPGLLFLALVKLLKISLYLLMAAVIRTGSFVLGEPSHTYRAIADTLTWRFLQPLRRIVPMLGQRGFVHAGITYHLPTDCDHPNRSAGANRIRPSVK